MVYCRKSNSNTLLSHAIGNLRTYDVAEKSEAEEGVYLTFERLQQLVSVVIPCYNAASYIEDCLDHLYSQSYSQIEIIVVDDASTDNTVHQIQMWQSHCAFPRFELLQLPRNVGFSGALTTGLFMARGEFIANHDADDYSHPDRISRQVSFLMENQHISMVGTNYIAFNDEDPCQQTLSNWLSYGDDIPQQYRRGEHCVSHPTVLYRGILFDRLGGLTRNMNGAEDYEFIAKCVQAGYKVENLRDVLYYYRSHEAQRSREFYSS